MTTPTIIGTAEAGSLVTVYDGGVFLASGWAEGGNYAIAVSLPNGGVHSLTSKATDIAGNTSGALSARG